MDTAPSHGQVRSPSQPLHQRTYDSGIKERPDAGLQQRKSGWVKFSAYNVNTGPDNRQSDQMDGIYREERRT